jgi:hemerythrin-like domain-containing protein
MPVTLGARPQANFDQPLELLSDCHRRIEHFLSVLVTVVDRRKGQPMDDEHRRAVVAALRYFDEAAPKHTADEEESLFPRLRELAKVNAQVASAMSQIDTLESDHEAANQAHAEVSSWFECWLSVGTLQPGQVNRLQRVLDVLQQLYCQHIAVEDREVFRLASQVLTQREVSELGQEMLLRRSRAGCHNTVVSNS